MLHQPLKTIFYDIISHLFITLIVGNGSSMAMNATDRKRAHRAAKRKIELGVQEDVEVAEGGARSFIPPKQQKLSSPHAKATQEVMSKDGGYAAQSASSNRSTCHQ